MQVPVLIERVDENGYRARAGEPFGWTADGATPAEALQQLREVVAQRVAAGATIATLDLSVRDHPWMELAGTWKGHPLLDDWKKAVAEYRQAVDNDPERL